jgi:hypothetical protein
MKDWTPVPLIGAGQGTLRFEVEIRRQHGGYVALITPIGWKAESVAQHLYATAFGKNSAVAFKRLGEQFGEQLEAAEELYEQQQREALPGESAKPTETGS